MPGVRGTVSRASRGDREDEWFGDALLVSNPTTPRQQRRRGFYLEGRKVGHLEPSDGPRVPPAIVRDGIAGRNEYAVAARVYWGGADRCPGVTLDLPQT